MTRSHVHDRGDSLSIRFGPRDVEIPEPLAGFVRAHLQAPRRHTSIAVPHAANPDERRSTSNCSPKLDATGTR
jgi:hypothetical protein